MHTNTDGGLGARRRRLAGTAAMLLVVASLTTAVTSRVQADEPPVVVVDRWRPSTLPPDTSTPDGYWSSVRLYAEPGSRRLFADGGTWLSAYDLDSLKPLGGGTTVPAFATSEVPDAHTGTLFRATSDVTGTSVAIEQYGADSSGTRLLARLDLTTKLPDRQIVGMYRVPGTEIVYLVSVSATRQTSLYASLVTISEVDLGPGVAAGRLDWSVDLPLCASPMQFPARYIPAAIGFVAAKQAVYFSCTNAQQTLVTPAPQGRGAARLQLHGDPRQGATPTPTSDDFTLFPRAGDFFYGDSFFDAGSGRLVLTAAPAGGAQVYGFDTLTDTYTGVATANKTQNLAAGMDPTSGRYYGLAQSDGSGLHITDVRGTPMPQGVLVTERRSDSNLKANDSPIAVDPVRRRFFVHYAVVDDSRKPTVPPFFAVIEDRLPPYTAPPSADPDTATSDVDEQPGRTRSTFGVAARGYGSRLRQVGGAKGLVANYTTEDLNPFPVGPGTRELRGASADYVRLADGEATAAAISADRDLANTQADFDKAGGAGAWPYQRATCVDLSGEAASDVADDARATCDADKEVAFGSAVAPKLVVGDRLKVEGGTAEVTLRRDPDDGATASMTATARGIDVLGGALHIEKVEVTATAAAHGRPGTARSTYRRSLTGVVIDGVSQCGTNCDAEEIARRVNERFAGRVRVEFPEPDPMSRATPRGYAATVRRDPYHQLQEVVLNEQPPDRAEVPGMVVSMVEDIQIPSRTVLELAAVELEAHYAITSLGDDAVDGGPVDLLGRPLGQAAAADGTLFDAAAGLSSLAGSRLASSGGRGPGLFEDPGAFLRNSLALALRLFPVWAVLLAPVYISARRRLLLQRWFLSTGGGR